MRSWWGDALRRFLRHRVALVGLLVICLLSLIALLAPLVARHDPTHQYTYIEKNGEPVVDENGDWILDHTTYLAGPSQRFWLGTDESQRDVYSRLVHGARVSLAVGVFSQALALALGLAVGMAAGLGGRWADTLLMRLTDIAYAFPDLLLIILLASAFGSSALMLILVIALVSWATIARLVRGQLLSLREEEYVLAARAAGASGWRLAWHHLLPNLLGPVIVAATFGIPAAIFAEAALGYMGLGFPPPSPSWGVLIDDSFRTFQTAPHLVVPSCLAVAITMMSFTFIGDGLRDALDPRTPRRRRPSPDTSMDAVEPGPAVPAEPRRAA